MVAIESRHLDEFVAYAMTDLLGPAWEYMACVQQPWTLTECIIMTEKHWLAVFAEILPRNFQMNIDALKAFFNKYTATAVPTARTRQEIKEIGRMIYHGKGAPSLYYQMYYRNLTKDWLHFGKINRAHRKNAHDIGINYLVIK